MRAKKVIAFVVGYTPDPPSVYGMAAGFRATHASVPVERMANSPATFGRIIAEPGQRHQRGASGAAEDEVQGRVTFGPPVGAQPMTRCYRLHDQD